MRNAYALGNKYDLVAVKVCLPNRHRVLLLALKLQGFSSLPENTLCVLSSSATTVTRRPSFPGWPRFSVKKQNISEPA